jgi:hypothetical protein
MKKSAERPPSSHSTVIELRPTLLSAALAGLLGAAACDDGNSSDGTGKILSSSVRPDLTLEEFTEECDDQQGEVELHAHCGGVNSCKGFSYDDETFVFTVHSCKALNTCSGYSCVVPDEE